MGRFCAEPEGGWGVENGTGQGTGDSKAEGGASREEKGRDSSGSPYRLQFQASLLRPPLPPHSPPMSTLPCLHSPPVILTFLPPTWSHLRPLNMSRVMSQSLKIHSPWEEATDSHCCYGGHDPSTPTGTCDQLLSHFA